MLNFTSNKRNNNVLPFKGYYFEVTLTGYKGLNDYSKSFVQIKPEFTYYQPLDAKGNIVLSDRVGGGISFGKPAFYQSMFLGGQGNLLGYLQNRFAGQNMFFNNLQGRVKIADIASYILPGQLGITGFYDTGRVWVSGEHSDKWHTGAGGGLYFAPASLTVLQLLAGHSEEGWYPYISLNFRL
jgi:outer membrane protein assembly factor BamA